VKSSLYGDVSEKTMMGMFYPCSVGTLTCVKLIATMCECACATVSERFTLAGHFFLLVRTSCIIKSLNQQT
jgi:hypothetical protein